VAVELDADANGAIDVSKGGTNATTAAGARTNLGLQIIGPDPFVLINEAGDMVTFVITTGAEGEKFIEWRIVE
jgi:hypothetical protein